LVFFGFSFDFLFDSCYTNQRLRKGSDPMNQYERMDAINLYLALQALESRMCSLQSAIANSESLSLLQLQELQRETNEYVQAKACTEKFGVDSHNEEAFHAWKCSMQESIDQLLSTEEGILLYTSTRKQCCPFGNLSLTDIQQASSLPEEIKAPIR